jgi:hypothetical protein
MRAKAEEEEEGLVRQGIPLDDRVENEAACLESVHLNVVIVI